MYGSGVLATCLAMLRLALLCILVFISACSARPVRDRSSEGLVLRILHMNDHHSRLSAERMKVSLEGRTLLLEGGSFALAAGYIRQREQAGGAVLKLHAGDALTGDLFFTLFRGQADADLMNSVCFDAFAVGNHEFDDGDAGLRRFLDHLRSPAFACETAVLAANVVPRVGESPLALLGANDYLKPYAVFERDGVRIGVIGLVIAEKTRHSSRLTRVPPFSTSSPRPAATSRSCARRASSTSCSSPTWVMAWI